MQHSLLRFYLRGVVNNKAVVIFSFVKPFQVIKLNDVDKIVGIARVGGIATSLQSPRPSLVVGDRKTKKRAIAWLLRQKLTMILITIKNRGISTETFLRGIIIRIDCSAGPTMTLYAKMVVRLPGT